MRFLRTIILTLFFTLLGAGVAKAQFSISKVKPAETQRIPALDSVIVINEFGNRFHSEARKEAERKRLRRERNTFEFNASLQASQTQFENWAAGGDNTFSARSTLFLKHRHQREKRFYELQFEGRYGMNYIESKRHKNEDEFKLKVATGWRMHRNWYYSASGELRSQFMTGYKSRDDRTRTSTFMAPGFLDLSIGVKYEKKPFMLELAPVSGSAVFVLDRSLRERGMNGVEVGAATKWEIGPMIRAEVDHEFWKKIFRVRSYFKAFTNLKKAPVVRWETTFDIRATNFLTTTLYGLLYFDKDALTPKRGHLQMKYSISVGLSYTFKNK